MTEPGSVPSVPGSSGGSVGAGRGLPGRVRSLSSPPPPGRLTSLRTRDLTLGGPFKKTKKVFEPNVHAVRKSKDELKQELCVASKKERRERDERRRESRGGRRRDRPQTIQSHSIFEQGPADTGRKTGWRGAKDLHDSGTSPVCKLVKKERKEPEEKEEEDEILTKLQRDDFIDDPGLRNDERLKPIQLPLCQCSSSTRTHAATVNTSAAVAEEEADLGGTEQPSLVQLLRDLCLSEKEELFFMQLPDCMPARTYPLHAGPASALRADRPAEKEAKSDSRRTAHLQQETVVKDGCPPLSHFPEGLLGKLQIRKSGKVDLKLGDIVLNVSEGAAFSFLQQLVSVRLSEGRTGDMTVLGNVQHKLVLSPDFQALLHQAGAEQSQG